MLPTLKNPPTASLTEQFGQIDIYLFDQLLKGRITPDSAWCAMAANSSGERFSPRAAPSEGVESIPVTFRPRSQR